MKNNIIKYLFATQSRYPDKIAFEDTDGGKLTFTQLRQEVEKIGSALIKMFNCTKIPVVVLTERNIKSIPAFLGAVYSGNFYIPVDATLPDSRIEEMLAIANPIITINCSDRNFDIKTFNIVNYGDINNDEHCVDFISSTLLSPLYGIFTSGSTGVPKLVVKNHLSIYTFIEDYIEVFDFSADDIQGNQIPFYFDASTKDLYTTLILGCTTKIISKGFFSQPGRLAQTLIDNNITSICWVPSALSMLSMFNVFQKIKPTGLKRVLFVGEPMPAKQLNIWMDALPNVRYINLYGSTENAGNSLYYEIKEKINDGERVPIGKSFSCSEVFLLDDSDNMISKDNTTDSGEICISGALLAMGYYDNLKITNEKFCQNPNNNHYLELIFRTGDVGKYDNNQNIVYLCRKDYQIKLNGYRIELGDIEVAATATQNIDSACCIFDENKKKIVLFYSAKNDERESLIQHLKNKLPAYMLPAKYIYMENMPLNQNGKIHRTKLKEMYQNNNF